MRVLDLFCGAGGAARGYADAWDAEIVGVDISDQRNFPYEFVRADAMEFPLDGFDFVHASPPCQRFSSMTRRHGTQHGHPDLVAPIRSRLQAAGVPYVIENVEGAPLIEPIRLCGSMFGLEVRRHRLFESNVPLAPPPPCDHARQGRVIGVYGNPGGSSKRDGLTFGGTEDWRRAMDIDWMTAKELAQSIPPAFTHWIATNMKGPHDRPV